MHLEKGREDRTSQQGCNSIAPWLRQPTDTACSLHLRTTVLFCSTENDRDGSTGMKQPCVILFIRTHPKTSISAEHLSSNFSSCSAQPCVFSGSSNKDDQKHRPLQEEPRQQSSHISVAVPWVNWITSHRLGSRIVINFLPRALFQSSKGLTNAGERDISLFTLYQLDRLHRDI